MQAIILSVGDELTLGQVVNTNSAWLSEQLAGLGMTIRAHATLPDDQCAIARAFDEASRRCDLLVATGGLGPTRDDLTRQALAQALGCELEMHAPSMERIENLFRERRWPMAESNRTQAMRPALADVLENRWGTAPGLKARLNGCRVYVLPGVPAEMKAMFDALIRPELGAARDRVILTRTLGSFGAGESSVGERLGGLMDRARNPKVGTTVSAGVISIRVRSEFPSRPEAERALDETVAEVRSRLGSLVFGEGDETLQDAAVRLLLAKGRTVAVAESCTGGLLGQMLTDVPGSSACFTGGWIAYSNSMKERELQVPHALLQSCGAVSGPVAREMAERAALLSGSDYGLAITGIAGPGGGSAEKPVGLVWIALARGPGGTLAEEKRFSGGRAAVRDRAAKSALNMLRLELMEP